MTDHTDYLKKKHALFRNFRFHLHMLLTVTNQLINNSGASLGQRQLIQKFDYGFNCFNKKDCMRIGSYVLLSLPVVPEPSKLTWPIEMHL